MKNSLYIHSGSYPLRFTGLLFNFIIMTWIEVVAQPSFTIYADVANNSISDGLFIRSAFFGYYRSVNYQLKAGVQANLVNGNNIILSGYRIDGSRDFKIKNIRLEIDAFRLWTACSGILKEINYGFVITMKTKHFDVQTGTNFRTFSFRRKAFKDYEIGDKATAIHENFNLMYSLGYNIKPSYSKWNAGVTLTNIDYFMINQETNPYVNLKGYYKLSTQVSLFAEGWYKNAGVTNISSNYFGFVIRGGVQWNFN